MRTSAAAARNFNLRTEASGLRPLQILKRVGYDGYCSIEFEGSEDCIEGISKGFENLKGMLARI